MFTVFVRDLQFYAFHGVPVEERAVGHRYVAEIEFDVEDAAGSSDSVHDTVDYGSVASFVVERATTAQFRTLERLVTVVGDDLLARHAAIRRLRLRIGKLAPPMPVIADRVEVERSWNANREA